MKTCAMIVTNVRYDWLAAIDNALRNGSHMNRANLAFELLCDEFGVDRADLVFIPKDEIE